MEGRRETARIVSGRWEGLIAKKVPDRWMKIEALTLAGSTGAPTHREHRIHCPTPTYPSLPAPPLSICRRLETLARPAIFPSRGREEAGRCTRIRSPPAASAPSTSASMATSPPPRAPAAGRVTTFRRAQCKHRSPQSFCLPVRGVRALINCVASLCGFESAPLWASLCVVCAPCVVCLLVVVREWFCIFY
jgi:hypothetical protein